MSETQQLIDFIQNKVKPDNKLPEKHPRIQVPDWIFEDNIYELVPVNIDQELTLEPDIDTDLSEKSGRIGQYPNPDNYAYYLPFHFYKSRWGIYIKSEGVIDISAQLLGVKTYKELNNFIINSVFQMLLQHEAFHYKTELACSRFESQLLEYLKKCIPYEFYFCDASAGLHEEAMANAHSLSNLRKYHKQKKLHQTSRGASLEALISGFMDSQPDGYKDYGQYGSSKDFKSGQDRIINFARETGVFKITSNMPPSQVLGRHFFTEKVISPCPIYLIQKRKIGLLKIIKPFPVSSGIQILVHTNDHQPPHFHLKSSSGDDLGKYEWPSLNPLPGTSRLTSKMTKKLKMYLSIYGTKIEKKMNSIHGKHFMGQH